MAGFSEKTLRVLKRKGISAARARTFKDKPGGSNAVSNLTKFPGPFGGPAGGGPPGSGPIHDLPHARNLLARAKNFPNPAGARRAVFDRFPGLVKNSKFNASGRLKKAA